METDSKAAAIFGNVTLDIICKTVDDVPRYDSITFQDAAVTPGGCASNTAIGLARLGERVYLIACTGEDQPAEFLHQTWGKQGVDTRFVTSDKELGTGISVGLVDSDFQPRFIHTSGANGRLNKEFLVPELLQEQGVGFVHVAGYFVLPGLMEDGFSERLHALQQVGIHTSLDVVRSPAMDSPVYLSRLLSHLDLFLCNQAEGEILTGYKDPQQAASAFIQQGARGVIIKMGAAGCWLADPLQQIHVPGVAVDHVVDTTGAGDAFAAGLLAALINGLDNFSACQAGIREGTAAVKYLGAVQLD